MELIIFKNGHTYYNVTLHKVDDHIVRVTFEDVIPLKELHNGFTLVNEKNYRPMAYFLGYTTVYRTYDDKKVIEFSDDGSVYVAPAPIIPQVTFVVENGGIIAGEVVQNATNYFDLVVPTPIPDENYVFIGWLPEIPMVGEITKDIKHIAKFEYVPTLIEIQEKKVADMNDVQQMVIANGVNVTMSDGTVEHFSLTAQNQASLTGLQSMVVAGEEMIPWHNSNEEEHCKYYSNADMALITSTALAFITYHVTYFRDLRIYVRALKTKDEVESVYYGMDLPEEYQSEPLKNMLLMNVE